MAKQAMVVAAKPDDLNSIPWPHRVEGKSQSLEVVFRSPLTFLCAHIPHLWARTAKQVRRRNLKKGTV